MAEQQQQPAANPPSTDAPSTGASQPITTTTTSAPVPPVTSATTTTPVVITAKKISTPSLPTATMSPDEPPAIPVVSDTIDNFETFIQRDVSTIAQQFKTAFVELTKDAAKPNVLVAGTTGAGKCLGAGTLILMADATMKKVEDVVVGDLLVGDDGRARVVISTEIPGKDNLYRVRPLITKAASNGGVEVENGYVCSSRHKLVLESSMAPRLIHDVARGCFTVNFFQQDNNVATLHSDSFIITDFRSMEHARTAAEHRLAEAQREFETHKPTTTILVSDLFNDYSSSSSSKQFPTGCTVAPDSLQFVGARRSISQFPCAFDLQSVMHSLNISSSDLQCAEFIGQTIGRRLAHQDSDSHHQASFERVMEAIGMTQSPVIPSCLLAARFEVRLALLRGIVTTAARLIDNHCYQLQHDSQPVMSTIAALSRSVGQHTTIHRTADSSLFTVTITMTVAQRSVEDKQQQQQQYPIEICAEEESGDYYGFTLGMLDGDEDDRAILDRLTLATPSSSKATLVQALLDNKRIVDQDTESRYPGRFLLGDCTVTHNSSLINSVFGRQLAKEGAGQPITTHFTCYAPEDANVVIYDSRGLEHGSTDAFIESTKTFFASFQQQAPVGKIGSTIHVVWYVINGAGSRIQPFEEVICRTLFQNIPLLFLINKADISTNEDRAILRQTLEGWAIPSCIGIFDSVSGNHTPLLNITKCPECNSDDLNIRKKKGIATCEACHKTISLLVTKDEVIAKTLETIPVVAREAFIAAQTFSCKHKDARARIIISEYYQQCKDVRYAKTLLKEIARMLVRLAMLWDFREQGKTLSTEIAQDLLRREMTFSEKLLLFLRKCRGERDRTTAMGILWNRCLRRIFICVFISCVFDESNRDWHDIVGSSFQDMNEAELAVVEEKIAKEGLEAVLDRELPVSKEPVVPAPYVPSTTPAARKELSTGAGVAGELGITHDSSSPALPVLSVGGVSGVGGKMESPKQKSSPTLVSGPNSPVNAATSITIPSSMAPINTTTTTLTSSTSAATVVQQVQQQQQQQSQQPAPQALQSAKRKDSHSNLLKLNEDDLAEIEQAARLESEINAKEEQKVVAMLASSGSIPNTPVDPESSSTIHKAASTPPGPITSPTPIMLPATQQLLQQAGQQLAAATPSLFSKLTNLAAVNSPPVGPESDPTSLANMAGRLSRSSSFTNKVLTVTSAAAEARASPRSETPVAPVGIRSSCTQVPISGGMTGVYQKPVSRSGSPLPNSIQTSGTSSTSPIASPYSSMASIPVMATATQQLLQQIGTTASSTPPPVVLPLQQQQQGQQKATTTLPAAQTQAAQPRPLAGPLAAVMSQHQQRPSASLLPPSFMSAISQQQQQQRPSTANGSIPSPPSPNGPKQPQAIQTPAAVSAPPPPPPPQQQQAPQLQLQQTQQITPPQSSTSPVQQY